MQGQIELVHTTIHHLLILLITMFLDTLLVKGHKRMNSGYQDDQVLAANPDNLSSIHVEFNIHVRRKEVIHACLHT